jgi:hypothetical protein
VRTLTIFATAKGRINKGNVLHRLHAQTPNSHCVDRLSKTVIGGLSAAAVVALLAIGIVAFFFLRRRKRRPQASKQQTITVPTALSGIVEPYFRGAPPLYPTATMNTLRILVTLTAIYTAESGNVSLFCAERHI